MYTNIGIYLFANSVTFKVFKIIINIFIGYVQKFKLNKYIFINVCQLYFIYLSKRMKLNPN